MLLAMAVVAAISIAVWLLVAVPELEKMPVNYDSRTEFVGRVSWLEPETEGWGGVQDERRK